MKFISLTRGKHAIVDDDDLDRLTIHRWQWRPPRFGNGSGYAARTVHPGKRNVFMHQEILPSKDGYEPDHINGNGLDNRKENLRYATRRQQSLNRSVRSNNKSGFKGVSVASANRYKASIWIDRKNKYLGIFTTPEEAARAYNKAAKQFYGDFARLNFPWEVQ